MLLNLRSLVEQTLITGTGGVTVSAPSIAAAGTQVITGSGAATIARAVARRGRHVEIISGSGSRRRSAKPAVAAVGRGSVSAAPAA
jgi:hypothetical protein